mgnify:CR=1 FL=1
MVVKLNCMDGVLFEKTEKMERCSETTLEGTILSIAGVVVVRFLELSGESKDAIGDAASPNHS